MAVLLKDRFNFLTGVARNSNIAYFLAVSNNLTKDEDELANSHVFEWNNKKWKGHLELNWEATSICVCHIPREQMVVLGREGQVVIAGQGEIYTEDIFSNTESEELSSFREVREIVDKAYAVGMDYSVYRRDGRNQWIHINNGLSLETSKVVGFESVHGFSESDIYAVGWNGEIWHYNGILWSQVNSPTNLILTKVLCAGDGYVYACGQAGILLRGKKNRWEIIEQDETDEDFWDIEWFNGKLYISTIQFLYTLKDDLLVLEDFNGEIPETCYHLSSADGVMWSIGAKDIVVFDGNEWTPLDMDIGFDMGAD